MLLVDQCVLLARYGGALRLARLVDLKGLRMATSWSPIVTRFDRPRSD